MKILDKYLVQRLFALFLKTCISLILLFIVIDVMTHRRDAIMERNVPAMVVVEYYVSLVPMILNGYQIAPLSLLISGLLVFGTFVQRNEYTAALAGGIGLRRIIFTPLIVALAVTVGMFVINEVVGPKAAKRCASIESNYFDKVSEGDERERAGIFWPELEGGWKCDIRTFDRAALMGDTVFVYAVEDDRHEQIEAKRIYWDRDEGVWMLEEGLWTIYDFSAGMRGRTTAITQVQAPFSESPEYLLTAEVDTQTQTIGQLAGLIEKHRIQSRTVRRLRLDMHKKIADPLVCMLFMALSLPFSIRLGRGGLSVGLSVAIFVGLGYLLISGITQSLGYSGQLSPIAAAWFPFGAYFFGCSALLLRTPT